MKLYHERLKGARIGCLGKLIDQGFVVGPSTISGGRHRRLDQSLCYLVTPAAVHLGCFIRKGRAEDESGVSGECGYQAAKTQDPGWMCMSVGSVEISTHVHSPKRVAAVTAMSVACWAFR